MPLVRREVADAVLQIIGSNPTAAIKDLATDHVHVTGYVTAEQLRILFSEARASIVPLRFGAGVKLKVVEAVHEGVPLVTTPVGVQGLEGLKEVVSVTGDPKAIAAAIVQLLRDDARWVRTGATPIGVRQSAFFAHASMAAIADAVNAALANAERRKAEPCAVAHSNRVGRESNRERLVARASQFASRFEQIKASTIVNFPWYPYDSFANLHHLAPIMPSEFDALLSNRLRIADIGAADGALSFYLESLGHQCDIYDHAPTNMNGLEGARTLKRLLNSKVGIFDIDIDSQFKFDRSYDILIVLGILYHLKNPYYFLETLAGKCRYLLLSTRLARYLSAGGPDVSSLPIAYLLSPMEANNDSTNYWIFTETGLRQLVDRAGWNVAGFRSVGDTINSNPRDNHHDERAIAVLESKALGAERPVMPAVN